MKPGEANGPPQVINLFLMSADWISETKGTLRFQKMCVEGKHILTSLCLIKENGFFCIQIIDAKKNLL